MPQRWKNAVAKATSDLYHMETSITVFLRGTPACSHMAAVSQWRVGAALYAPLLNVPSQCWICAALEGSYIASWGFFMEKNERQIGCVCARSCVNPY